MSPVNFKVGEEEYQLLPHTGFDAMDLDRKVLGIVGRMAYSGVDITEDAGAFALLSGVFSEMPTADYKWLVETTLGNVTVVTPGKKSFSLSSVDVIADHFAGRFNQLYAVMLKVWKSEKLSPFAEAPKTEQGGV